MSVDAFIELGGGEFNGYSENIKNNLEPGNSFYETFFEDTDLGFTVSLPGHGIGLGLNSYMEYSDTDIYHTENISESIFNVFSILANDGVVLSKQQKTTIMQSAINLHNNNINNSCNEECTGN